MRSRVATQLAGSEHDAACPALVIVALQTSDIHGSDYLGLVSPAHSPVSGITYDGLIGLLRQQTKIQVLL